MTDEIGAGYTPIACAIYDQYEIAISRRRRMRLRWAEGNVLHDEIVTPRRLETRQGQEFMHGERDGGGLLCLRLDWITRQEII